MTNPTIAKILRHENRSKTEHKQAKILAVKALQSGAASAIELADALQVSRQTIYAWRWEFERNNL